MGFITKTGFYQARQEKPEPRFGEEDSQEYDQKVFREQHDIKIHQREVKLETGKMVSLLQACTALTESLNLILITYVEHVLILCNFSSRGSDTLT